MNYADSNNGIVLTKTPKAGDSAYWSSGGYSQWSSGVTTESKNICKNYLGNSLCSGSGSWYQYGDAKLGCPSMMKLRADFFPYWRDPHGHVSVLRWYGMNLQDLCWIGTEPDGSASHVMHRVRNPSAVLFHGERTCKMVPNGVSVSYFYGVHGPSGRSTNILFFDGHVGTKKFQNVFCGHTSKSNACSICPMWYPYTK